MNSLSRIRLREGFTLKELSEKSAVDTAKLNRVERGLVDMPGMAWKAVAEVLGVTVDELLADNN